ncbi:spore cortex biosynthesis protein YabQ [Alkalihalobacillus sp. AL-G]|uniref:spore cortex biosynthesis protein YabQ n=1 Tax=Alkalihalobacillus sp. AL-G TaxID=2926399 RepID=UPI00272C3E10|nr:spore cortex biosynthesis protein YabQ [Alkalihalobacillus sp. AL-G]WLD93472.1 spore cortex biosynthesis protein YabQ [Alkalihalobacillus sp. AL-G]
MTLTVQFYTILAMIGSGIWLGATLDTYHRFHPRGKRWNWLRFINDILFWVLQALIIFYVLLQVNRGEVRVIIFLALLCGFACYQGLLQSLYKRLLERIIKITIGIIRLIRRTFTILVYNPAKVILNLLVGFSKMIGRLLLSVLLFITGILIYPLKLIGRLLLRLIPKKIWTNLKGVAGIIRKSTNTVKSWIGKLRR